MNDLKETLKEISKTLTGLSVRISNLESRGFMFDGTGAPGFNAGEGTFYWDYTNDNLYANNNSAAGWTLIGGGGGIVGAGAAPQVAYFTGVNSIAGDAGFTYNAANDIAIITGTSVGGYNLVSAAVDSPAVRWTNGADTFTMFLDHDAIAGNSDIVLTLPAADADTQFIVRNSGAVDVAYIDGAGNADFRTHLAVGTSAAVSANYIVNVQETTTIVAGTFYGVRVYVNANPGAGSAATTYAAIFDSQSQAANVQNINEIRGLINTVSHVGTGNVTATYAAINSTGNTNGGTVTTSYANYNTIVIGAGAQVTTARVLYAGETNAGTAVNATGLYVDALSATTNIWGVYIVAQTGATNTYSIYSAGTVTHMLHLGHIAAGATAAVTGTRIIDAQDTNISSTSGFQGVNAEITKTAGATDYADQFHGGRFLVTINQPGGEVGNVYGVLAQGILTAGTIGNAISGRRYLWGGQFTAQQDGGTVTNEVLGCRALADMNAGTVNDAVYGINVTIDQEAGHTINTDAFVVWIYGDFDGTVAGTSYLLYFNDVGSNVDYCLYQGGANASPSYHSGYWVNGSSMKVGGSAGDTPAAQMHVVKSDAVTNTVSEVERLDHLTSGAAAAGFGLSQTFYGESAAGTSRLMATLGTEYIDATDATRYTLIRMYNDDAGSAVGYCGFWSKDNVNNNAVTVIRNASGDVTEVVTFMYSVSAITAGDATGGTISLEPGDTYNLYDDGTDVLTIACGAGGDVTVQRTAGADTFKVALWGVWI